jgi:hypothetical protein
VINHDPFSLPILPPPGSTNALKPLPPLPRRRDQTPARLHALVCIRRISAGFTVFTSLDQRLDHLSASPRRLRHPPIGKARGWK